MRWKEAYQDMVDAQYREWRAYIEQFQCASASLPEIQLADRQRWIEKLTKFLESVAACLEELRRARSERWEFTRQSVERAMIDFKSALDASPFELPRSLVPLQEDRSHVYEPFRRKGNSLGIHQ